MPLTHVRTFRVRHHGRQHRKPLAAQQQQNQHAIASAPFSGSLIPRKNYYE